jgi:undecaprenyl pyrophosphate phosphatase UppP
MREQSKRQCRDSIHSSHVRNFSMSADFDNEAWRFILLPVYLAAYRFDQRVFQVLVNGQSGKIAGQKPVAWWKIWLAIAALLLPALVLGLVGFAQKAQVYLLIALVLFVLSVIGAVVLFTQAASAEKA